MRAVEMTPTRLFWALASDKRVGGRELVSQDPAGPGVFGSGGMFTWPIRARYPERIAVAVPALSETWES